MTPFISMKVTGIQEAIRKLQQIENKLVNIILKREMKAATQTMAASVKDEVPVDTGMLRRNIRVRSAKRKKGRVAFTARIARQEGEKWYANTVQMGGGKGNREPDPFMTRGFEDVAPGLADSVPQKIWSAIEKECR